MSVKFNVISKGQPGVAGGGQKKFYAIVNSSGNTTLRNLAEKISKRSTVSVIDTIAVLEGLLQVLPEELQQGRLVQLGDFGSMRLSISSEGSENEEDVSADNIKSSKILFRPGRIIQNVLQALRFTKETT